MSELPPEQPPLDAVDDTGDSGDGNVAIPVPVDSPAATSGDGASPAVTLPPALPA